MKLLLAQLAVPQLGAAFGGVRGHLKAVSMQISPPSSLRRLRAEAGSCRAGQCPPRVEVQALESPAWFLEEG